MLKREETPSFSSHIAGRLWYFTFHVLIRCRTGVEINTGYFVFFWGIPHVPDKQQRRPLTSSSQLLPAVKLSTHYLGLEKDSILPFLTFPYSVSLDSGSQTRCPSGLWRMYINAGTTESSTFHINHGSNKILEWPDLTKRNRTGSMILCVNTNSICNPWLWWI